MAHRAGAADLADAGDVADQVRPAGAALWSTMIGQLGVGGLAVPVELGGAGAGPRECAVVLEELGRAAAPTPYLGSAVLATYALLSCSDTDLLSATTATRDLLSRLAAGTATATLTVPFSTTPGTPLAHSVTATPHPSRNSAGVGPFDRTETATPTESRQGVAADPAGEEPGWAALTGRVSSVADALDATVLLVPTPHGLYAVDADAPGVTRRPIVSLDVTRPVCDLEFHGASGRLLAGGDAAADAVELALLAGAGLLASEQVGLAQWCLDTTVEYLRDRSQFGRPVGSFQALKHRLADLWVSVSQARAVARYAAGCLAELDFGPAAPAAAERLAEVRVAVALAQAHCADVAVRAAEECVQLHGGIGFTWEHPAHLYLKRAKADALAFGTADQHRTRLAELVDLPAA
jgi:alkylation response protein AidB-like acyl-CoA dehydrogenase